MTERAIAPSSGRTWWVLVDTDTFVVCPEVSEFVLSLDGKGRSPHTIRSYVPRIGWFLNWCLEQGVEWSTVRLGDLSRFKVAVERTPTVRGATRSGRSVNAVIAAISSFLRFCHHRGYVAANVVEQLSEARTTRLLPRGMNVGENGQWRPETQRTLKAREVIHPPQVVPSDKVAECLDAAMTWRDRFLFAVLGLNGLRIGEALGLRRSDMHLLPSSSHLGCSISGAHLHVVARESNPNRTRGKSKRPRWVPVTDELVGIYREYLVERSALTDGDSDMVFVNLAGRFAGKPMTYPNAYQIIKRVGDRADCLVRPHMLRHTAATEWTRSGVRPDVVRDLLGHASLQSTAVYQHPSDDELRSAVENAAAGAAR